MKIFKISFKTLAWGNFVAAISLILLGLVLLNPRDLSRDLDLNSSKLVINDFNDQTDNGNSKTLWKTQTEEGIAFSHVLHPGMDYPYAGIELNFTDGDSLNCPNWGPYQTLEIKLQSQSSDAFRLSLFSHIPREMRVNLEEKKRQVYQLIPATKNVVSYSINLKRSIIPEWWRIKYKLPYLEDRSFTNHGVCLVTLGNYQPHLDYAVVDTTRVFSMTLKGEAKPYPGMGTLAVVLGIFLLILPAIRPKQFALVGKSKPKALFVEDSNTKWVILIKEAYETHYHEEGISVEEMAKYLGTHVKKLQVSLKNDFAKTHKAYLNELRVQEAKRLLCESKEAIGLIANTVGYSTITHFNRVFKEVTDRTPGQYRKENV
jgi:AraC-like DNA-binding protein